MPEENEYWLSPEERKIIIGALFREGIIIYDPEGKLPLKSGGTTDTYVNLRDMRSAPHITRALCTAYATVILGLKVKRIVEVPDGVSILAGALTIKTDIPVVTIRSEEKQGRVTKGKMIGKLDPGDPVVILDDVITDGASKIPVISDLLTAGADIKAIVVLVDRDQGWRNVIPQNIPVLAGMNLSHIREYLKKKAP